MTSLTMRAADDLRAGAAAEPLRIAVLADDLYPGYGGQARATEGHVAALRRRGHRVRALVGRERSPSRPPEGVEVRRLPAWRPGGAQTHFALPSPRATHWLLQDADVLQANTPTPLALGAARLARRRGIPVVMGVHAQLESTTLHVPRGRRLAGAALRAWYGRVYGTADLLTAPTPFAARMAAGLASTPVEVVSNGVELPSETPSRAAARTRLPSALRDDAAATVLLYVGRLSPEKRPVDLLDLLRDLPGDVRLWIAGSGPLEARLPHEARARGVAERVRFLGYVDEATKHLLLAAADLFVMPSPTELQSIATLEAMAHGCAVAAAGFATSAVPDLVREAGAGLVYATDDPARAARRIRELLEDAPRLHAMQAGARRGAAAHAVERSGERLEMLYRGLLRARAGAPR